MRREVGPIGLEMSNSYPGKCHYVDTSTRPMSVKVRSAYKPSGPSVPELIPVTVATRSISTPPWMGC